MTSASQIRISELENNFEGNAIRAFISKYHLPIGSIASTHCFVLDQLYVLNGMPKRKNISKEDFKVDPARCRMGQYMHELPGV